MGKPKKRKKVKVRVKQSAKLIHRNDATRVEKQDTIKIKKAKAKVYPDNGPSFKVRIKKK